VTRLHLGKTPATPSPKDIRIGSFLDVERVAALPPKPYHPHDTGFALQMYGNGPDETVAPGFGGAGDCVWAMLCNAIQLARHASGKPLAPLSGKSAIGAYSEVTGYRIGDDATDRGTDMGEAMGHMRHTGLLDLAGTRHRIGAYATYDPKNRAEHLAVIRTFGSGAVGIEFPGYAMDEFNAHKPWSYHAGGTIDGGHAILAPRYERVFTWAEEIEVTNPFLQHQADEGFALIWPEFLDGSQETPEGFDAAALTKILGTLT